MSESNLFIGADMAIGIHNDENVDALKLKNDVVEIITALVTQANNISNTIKGEIIEYETGTAVEYIDKTDTACKNAFQRYEELKNLPSSKFYTVGRNKAKAEKTIEALHDIIYAVENNACATKSLFNELTKLADYSNKIYGIAIMGLAANRMVMREISMRLKHASEEELSELARKELENVLFVLKQQQGLENKVDSLYQKYEEQVKSINKIRENLNELENSKEECDKRIYELQVIINEHKRKFIYNITASIIFSALVAILVSKFLL